MSNRFVYSIAGLTVFLLAMPVLGQSAPDPGGFMEQLDAMKTLQLSQTGIVLSPAFQAELGVPENEYETLVRQFDSVSHAREAIMVPHGLGLHPNPVTVGGVPVPTPPFNSDGKQPPTMVAWYNLVVVLNDPNASPEIITSKLEAYRAARSKAEEDLRQVEEHFRSLLTLRQEAVFVKYGLLD